MVGKGEEGGAVGGVALGERVQEVVVLFWGVDSDCGLVMVARARRRVRVYMARENYLFLSSFLLA